jgi:hypothetical protein
VHLFIKYRWFFLPSFATVFSMSGITFMIDSKGRKTAAVIDLRRHRRIWEDFYDTALVKSRAHEPRQSLASVKRRMRLTKSDA